MRAPGDPTAAASNADDVDADVDVDGRPIAAALVGAVVAVALCALVVWAIVGRATGGEQRVASPPEATASPPAALQPSASQPSASRPPASQPPTQPFSQPLAGETQRAAARAALDTWRWADRAHQTVRLPVNVAIDRYLEAPR